MTPPMTCPNTQIEHRPPEPGAQVRILPRALPERGPDQRDDAGQGGCRLAPLPPCPPFTAFRENAGRRRRSEWTTGDSPFAGASPSSRRERMCDLVHVPPRVRNHRSTVAIRSVEWPLDNARARRHRALERVVGVVDVDIEERREGVALGC